MHSSFVEQISVTHRADYHAILLNEAMRLGVDLRLNCEVVEILFENRPQTVLRGGEMIDGDVVVGADGLYLYLHDVSTNILEI